jgi:hypothetical protein
MEQRLAVLTQNNAKLNVKKGSQYVFFEKKRQFCIPKNSKDRRSY